jgi:predicted chitinase
MSFEFNFTEAHLAAMIPGNTKVKEWYAALCDILPKYGITSERRVAHFVSQCAHESNNFRTLEKIDIEMISILTTIIGTKSLS